MKLPTRKTKGRVEKVVAVKEEEEEVPQSLTKKIYHVSQSAIGRFMECRKKAQLTLEGWYLKRSSRALRYGSMTHAALEEATVYAMKHKSIPPAEVTQTAIQNFIRKWEEENQELVADEQIAEEMVIDAALVEVAVTQYVRFHSDDFLGGKKWIALEKKFEIPYRGVVLFGYIDAAYEKDNKVYIFETKTKGRISSDLVDLLHLDFQTFYYIHGFYKATGKFPKATVYNILRKFESKKRVTETPAEYAERFKADIVSRPEYYFVRVNTDIPRASYDTWVDSTLNPLLDDYRLWREGKAPGYMNTGNCEGKYGSCDFLAACSRGDMSCYGRRTKEEGMRHANRERQAASPTAPKKR